MLLGLSFPPYPFPFLAWIAFVPLLSAWDDDRTDGRSAFLDAYIAFLITFAVAFQWPLFHRFTATAVLSLPPLLILPMWMAVPFAISRPVYRRLGFCAGTTALIAFYIVMEYGLRSGPFAFPWPLLGHSQAEWYPVNRLASLGGVPLLTTVVLAANGIITAILGRAPTPARLVLYGMLPMLVAGRNAPLSEAGDPVQNMRQDRKGLRVAGIQPALPPDSWADLQDSTRVSLLLDLTSALVSQSNAPPDLIVWPETALPPYPSTSVYTDRLQSLVDSTRIPILAGAITSDSEDGSIYRNSALLIAPGAGVQSYDKINLVPFAERVPFTGVIPNLERWAIPAGGVSGYEPGENRTIFEISGHRFGVLICLETLFSDAARGYTHDNAEALIAITQDGWWGNSFGYRQHLAFNRLRSIETGLPMLQASVSGVSALIDSGGRVHELAGWMEPATWVVDVPSADTGTPTLYVRWGEWVTMFAVVLALAFATVTVVRGGIEARGAKHRASS